MVETVVSQILEDVYQAGALQLTLLAHGTKDVFHVQRASAPDWMLRIYPVTEPAPVHDRVSALAQLLVFLEQQQYPAERVVHTIHGELTMRSDAWRILVTTYLGSPLQAWQPASTGGTDPSHVQAGTAKQDPQLLFSIGALLSRLHAIDTTMPAAELIRAPGLQAASELAWASSQLGLLQARVPAHLQEELAHLNRRIQQIRSFDACPQTIIHGDGHLGNVVSTPASDYVFIDWEAAGRGAAVTDLGQLLSASVEPSDTTLHVAVIQAIIDGYCAHRMVSPIERDLLPDALRFRILVTLVQRIAYSIRVRRTIDDRRWTICRRLSSIVYRRKPERFYDSLHLAGAFEQRSHPGYQPTQRFWGATYAEWERHERRATRIAHIAQARLDALLAADV